MSCKKLIVGCLFFFISPLWAAQISRYTSRWAKVAQKLKIRIKSDKSTQTAPNPTDDSQKNKNKKNMLSIYPMNWTLVYKSEKQKTNIGHLIHCSKCTQTQTHIDGLFFFCFFVGGNSVNIFSPFSRRLLGWNISERRINPKHDGGPAASPTETRDFCLFCCQYFVADFFFSIFFFFFLVEPLGTVSRSASYSEYCSRIKSTLA